ncbi:hypothetical protein CRE_15660 [Caenorhabditis remanei]|uniref:F-box domain-containing protein n=1 Tax=Caenorhabditis remanei TaxID=31234 RepID=E3N864_CAERE|nr:hypothetical protein CRE_15660 [Caenorhabditis remanei]
MLDSPPEAKEFSDLPIDVIGDIVEKMKLKEQLILRKVCKQLRDVVDEQKTSPFEAIEISCGDTEIFCRYNCEDVVYPLRIPRDHHNAKVVHGDDYIGVACNDLKMALGNPKFVLPRFRFFYRSYKESVPSLEFETLVSFLESLGHKASVRSVDIDAPEIDVTIRILSCLNPKTLKSIETHRFKMSSSWSTVSTKEKLDELAEIEQWKQAEELSCPHPTLLFKPEHFASFKRITFKEFGYDSGALEKYKKIFLTPSSKTILLSIERRDEFQLDESIELPGTPAAPIEPMSVIRHFDIPNSGDYLEYHFLIGQQGMTITRKSRE